MWTDVMLDCGGARMMMIMVDARTKEEREGDQGQRPRRLSRRRSRHKVMPRHSCRRASHSGSSWSAVPPSSCVFASWHKKQNGQTDWLTARRRRRHWRNGPITTALLLVTRYVYAPCKCASRLPRKLTVLAWQSPNVCDKGGHREQGRAYITQWTDVETHTQVSISQADMFW